MYKNAVVAAVVPAYKEERMIGKVIETMPDFVDHIVIVDDCSPDTTADVVRATDDPRVELIEHEQNQGVGGAIVTGHKKAMELGSDINVVMAGDAQMDPDYLPHLLDKVTDGGYAFSKANRFYSPESFADMPKHRIFGNIVLSFMTKFASGYWNLFDPQNGYTAVRTSTLERIPLDRISKRYSFENDMLIHLNIVEASATDVPIPAVYGEEVSSIKLRRVIPELLRLLFVGGLKRFWYRYVLWSFSAIALLTLVGSLFLTFGLAAGVWMVVEIAKTGTATAATAMMVGLPIIVGTQMLISALQLDIESAPKEPDQPHFPTQKNGTSE